MNLLVTILQAAHCRSTHQYFVLDALPLVTSRRGQLLGRVLLKHHDQYLIGSKDPDTKFRDFRNHVVHVQDGYWGGAMKKAEIWYRNLIDDLNANRWSEAAYSAGVLSHYFTDPVMPLHTAQSDKESVYHRPMEWSVVKSYARIHHTWLSGNHKIVFELADGQGWLAEAIKNCAKVANRYYTELIERYDLKAGVRRPTEGFDQKSIDILAGLFGLATTGWAQVLDRAAEETTSEIPNVSLTTASVLATIKMPSRWITRRIESSQEKKAVQAIFDEFEATGTVKENLPAEVKSVKTEFAKDRAKQQRQERPTNAPVVTAAAPKEIDPSKSNPREERALARAMSTPKPLARQSAAPSTPPTRAVSSRSSSNQRRRPRLAVTDDLVDAPSIGPKTAKRFAAIGITTVAQFLSAAPAQMERDLATTWINAEKLTQWQAQARLVCAIASLCGYKSQLLVAIGVDSAEELSTRIAPALHQELKSIADTTVGRRILRSSKVPDLDDVREWIADAKEVDQTKMSA